MYWIGLLLISLLLIFLLVPVTPIRENFRTLQHPPVELIRNGQKEEEDIHRRDVLSRIVPYIPKDVQH
jgi:hypothetical protein